MAGLLSRLARGLAAGTESYGTSMLEEKRAKRLEAMRAGEITASRAFQTKETKQKQGFQTQERKASQEFQEKMARQKGDAKAKPDEVKFVKVNDETGKVITVYKLGRATEWDPETDVIRELGKGEPGVTGDTKIEAAAYAKAKAESMETWIHLDTTDFKDYGGSKELAEMAFSKQYEEAAMKGKLNEFLSGKGIKEEKVAPAKQGQKSKTQMVDLYIKQFDGTEAEALKAMAKDPKMPPALRDEAKRRTSKTVTRAKKAEFTDQKDWHLKPDMPQSARKKMTPALYRERRKYVVKERAAAAKIKSVESSRAVQELSEIYPSMSDTEKRKWRRLNLQYLPRELRTSGL